jgi:hypothetical protein
MNESAQSDNNAGRTLIYVHGRNFKPAEAELKDICVAAIFASLERDFPEAIEKFAAVDRKIAYYGDLSNGFLRSEGKRYDETLDIGDRRNALRGLNGLAKRNDFGVGYYDRVPGKNAIAEFVATVAMPFLRMLGLSRKLISKIAMDLGEYWNQESDFGAQIRDRVRTAICESLNGDEHVMLISHGTGCIIAYDVLWQLSNDTEYQKQFANRKIDSWITLGAPLGDTTVRDQLLGAGEKGNKRFPSNVVSWHNVSAEDDYMSHDNTLADDFKYMLAQKQVSCIRDYQIYNLAVRYGKSNPHSSVGYLIHPRIAQIISDWLD